MEWSDFYKLLAEYKNAIRTHDKNPSMESMGRYKNAYTGVRNAFYELKSNFSKPELKWRKVEGGHWQGEQPMDVCGIISQDGDKWSWAARVMLNCRDGFTSPPITGKALTFEGAKRIIQVLCEETGTLTQRGPQHDRPRHTNNRNRRY